MRPILVDLTQFKYQKNVSKVEDLSKTFESQRVKYGKRGIFNFNFKLQDVRAHESDNNKKSQSEHGEFEKNGLTCAGVRGKGQKGL